MHILKILFSIFSLCILAYLLVILFFYLKQDSMLFYTRRLQTDKKAFKDSNLLLKSYDINGTVLRGWLTNPQASRLIIYYGGNAEELSEVVPYFINLPDWSVLFVNFRGYGESDGKPTQDVLFSDASTIFDRISSEHKYEKTVLLGRSLGTGVACYIASIKSIDGLILTTPYDSIRNVGKQKHPYLPIDLLLKHRFESGIYFPKSNAPALVLLSEVDQIIPHERTNSLIVTRPENTRSITLANCDHNSIVDHTMYLREIESFLSEL